MNNTSQLTLNGFQLERQHQQLCCQWFVMIYEELEMTGPCCHSWVVLWNELESHDLFCNCEYRHWMTFYWVKPENWKWLANLSCVTVLFFLTAYYLSYNDVKILYLCYVVNIAYKPIFMEHMHCCKESTTFMRDYLGM